MSSRRLSVMHVEVLVRLVAGEPVSGADSDLRVTVYALGNRPQPASTQVRGCSPVEKVTGAVDRRWRSPPDPGLHPVCHAEGPREQPEAVCMRAGDRDRTGMASLEGV